MTTAVDAFTANDRDAVGRWAGSLIFVLALHAAVVLLLLSHRVVLEPAAAPPAAVMIDLAPLPVAVPVELQPVKEPEPIRPPPEPEPPQQEPVPIPEPEVVPPPPPIPVAPPQAVTLPAPQPKPKAKAKPKPLERRRPVEEPRVLPPPQPAPAPVASAAPPPSASTVAATRAAWQAQLLAWLSRHKRYPRAAQDQHQQGTAYLRFGLDRHGRVLAFRLDRSSGFPLLDEEVTALIQRAQPLPSPPAEVPGERFELVVPIEFSLRRH